MQFILSVKGLSFSTSGKFRKIRNGIEHGSKYDMPTTSEVLRIKSILNYILIMSFAK